MTKKRFNLTLTAETVKELQTIAKELKMPPSYLSLICDEAIAGQLKICKQVKSTGKFTITDILSHAFQEFIDANKEANEHGITISTDLRGETQQKSKRKKAESK
jgi:hypothetical protein